ncbi:hypothetical protein T484DRAFT_1954351 [Baffinella frigidus]|nr:hypothetical protein T484DRAFT_1954351 [Cryptophyta sp. CCMP2293]
MLLPRPRNSYLHTSRTLSRTPSCTPSRTPSRSPSCTPSRPWFADDTRAAPAPCDKLPPSPCQRRIRHQTARRRRRRGPQWWALRRWSTLHDSPSLSMYHPRYPEGGSCGRGLKLSESNSNASDGRRISSFLLASENKPFCRAMASRLPPNGGASDCCMAAHAAGRGPIVARSHVPADSAQSPAPEVMAPSGMLRSRTPGAGPGPARTLSAPCFKNGLPPILAGARSLFLLLKERWRHGMLLKLSWVFQLLP